MFCKYYLFPFIVRKFTFFLFAHKIKRMAKRQKDPEAARKLMEIADGLKAIAKNEKVLDEDDDE